MVVCLKVIGCDHLAAKLCLTLSERGGIKARALACLAELNKLQDAAWTAQAFGFGWLAFLLIKAVKGLETDWVHMLHLVQVCLLSPVFLMEKEESIGKIMLFLRKQTISIYLITHAECFHEECCSQASKSPDGWMTYNHISTDVERERHYLKCAHDHTASEWP